MTEAGAGAAVDAPDAPPVGGGSRRAGGDAIGVGFRGDIDGLRAVAIVLIVGYHVGLPFLPGGFIGVDVFFVISGFLISRNLLVESETTGGVALLRFWSRRIRRLVPALALMIVVVLGLALLVLSALQWQSVASQGRAAALYVSNIAYANQATDYFGEDVAGSLFLHTWSLGVEEQFYVIWPLLVAVAAALTARRRSLLRPTLVAIFAATFVVSFALCVVLTRQGSAHAFFGLPSRAWEFAAAGLLAALPVPRLLERRAVATAAAIVGGVLILAALVGFGADTDYPGAWPLIPVAGTLLLLLAGSSPGARGPNVVSGALAWAPCRAVGRVSYSWYLWHWPLILLAVAAFDRDDLWLTGAAALVALGVGAGTYALVENPVRFSSRLTRSLPATYVMGIGVTLVVLVATFGLTRYSDVELTDLASAAAASPAAPTVTLAEVRESKKDFTCAQDLTGANGAEYCVDGDVGADRTVMVIGDSHARHWKAAFAEAAQERGIRLVLRWRSVCPAPPVRIVKIDGSGEDLDCQEHQRLTEGLIDEIRPDAVVTATSDDYGVLVIGDEPRIDQAERIEIWRAGYRSFADAVRARGIRFGSVVDTPRLPADPLDCIADKGADACAIARSEALDQIDDYSEAERVVREDLGDVPVLDVNATLCPDGTCPVVIDGIYVYTDVDHLYREFTRTQIPAIERFLDELIGA